MKNTHDAKHGPDLPAGSPGGGLSAIAIHRPVFTTMVTMAILVLGIVGFARLGTDLFPDVSFPVVAVTIAYPGANPSEVENLVTKRIEDSVISLNGIDRVRTLSREGLSTTIVMFKLGVDVQEAATQVRERISQVRYFLPTEIKEPSISRFDGISAAQPSSRTRCARRGSAVGGAKVRADDVVKPLPSSRSTAWPRWT